MNREDLAWFREIIKSPRRELNLYGSKLAQDSYIEFNRRHRMMPLVGRKYFGAALLDLADSSAVELQGSKFATCRRKIKKSTKSGNTFKKIDPTDYLEHIFEINNSSGVRQGKPLASHYSDIQKVTEMAEQNKESFGVFSANDKLLAYCHAPCIGDVFVYSRILGHVDYLVQGTMYQLVSETNRYMSGRYAVDQYPRYAFYDMFFGATPGLRQFKKTMGFAPYRAIWHWQESKN